MSLRLTTATRHRTCAGFKIRENGQVYGDIPSKGFQTLFDFAVCLHKKGRCCAHSKK